VRPPRLNGSNMGLFATRSPHRPNPVGLTLARIEKIEGVSNMMNFYKAKLLSIILLSPLQDVISHNFFQIFACCSVCRTRIVFRAAVLAVLLLMHITQMLTEL